MFQSRTVSTEPYVAEFQGQLKTLLPMLQEHVILAYQEFGEKQQSGAQEDWQKEKEELLGILEESLQERVSHKNTYSLG